jgi:hypothetical protein
MGGEQNQKELAAAAVFRRGWDCGSQLYDSVELASVYRVLDRHLMTPPHARGSAAVPGANGVMERTNSRRRTAPAKAKKGLRQSKAALAKKTGTAVLRSVFRSVICSRPAAVDRANRGDESFNVHAAHTLNR